MELPDHHRHAVPLGSSPGTDGLGYSRAAQGLDDRRGHTMHHGEQRRPCRDRRGGLALVVGALLAAALLFTPLAAPVAAATPAEDQCFITAAHRVFLDREPSPGELDRWGRDLAAGRLPGDLPDSLATSDEWLSVEVSRLYRSALERAPEPEGLAFWTERLRTGGSVRHVAARVYGSPELHARAGGTDEAFVAALYDRILGRAAEPGGLAHWSREVGRRGRVGVAAQIFGSSESRTARVQYLYDRVLDRTADPAGRSYWTRRLVDLDDVRLAVLLAASAEFFEVAQRDCGQPEVPRTEHVVVIDWDGFDPAFLELADTPAIDALVARGSSSIATATFQTLSNPSRASLVTGALPRTHGNAGYYFDEAAGVARAQGRALEAETIAEAVGRQDRTVASVQWYMTEDHGTSYGDPRQLYVEPGGPFRQRVDAAIEILHQRPVDSGGRQVTVPEIPALLAVYGGDIDTLVHDEGTASPTLPGLMVEMDAQLGRLVQATRDVGIFEETTFILTGDHGMTDVDSSALPDLLEAIDATGYQTGVLFPPYLTTPNPSTEVVVIQGDRAADITLRGTADSPEGRLAVAAALDGLVGDLLTEVLAEDDFAALGASDKLGDFQAIPEPPYTLSLVETPGQPRAGHASRAEQEVPLIVSGPGFCTGVAPTAPELIDVAPTIAALLGVEPPADADGRILSEALAGTCTSG
ncbi:DUF4214 domain-containing protein [Iamia sp. SCSIO 61187]|uniref:alkaline phosphatase family protein n=1 Tax=Iamia sp. SCSIO 61187 TaxID=2722752 RepID=UPI001C631DA2|nr:alkaline phosphatase family protein [Iamia sp. SCSIO 61187]QYG93553.1 DUF4214 domain-containing protein [Iamia sp. SCSIO 61187]